MLLAACMTAPLAARSAAAEADAPLERAIKATYLYKFAPFVEWPESAFASPQSPFVLCVVGEDPFGDLLNEAVAGQRISGRPIIVQRLPAATRNSGCQILFAAGSPRQSVAAALAAVRGTPVLTVTDDQSNAAAKGIINFVLQENHVRFQINNAAAAASGLVISSKLLSLAVDVTPKT
jgi:hypothetical protein